MKISWRENTTGFSMAIVMVFLLLLVPLSMVMFKVVKQVLKFSVFDRHSRTAWESANSSLMDYMRQFSQSQSGNYLNEGNGSAPNMLSRPALSLGGGEVTFTATPNLAQRSIFLEAKGKYGLDPLNPGGTQRFTAVIRFQSDLTRYGIIYSVSTPWTGGNNSTYEGPLLIKGSITSVGSTGQIINNGPIVVTGNISMANSLTINGDFYLGGTKSGAGNILGTGARYNFVPALDYPTLDFNYYDTYSNFEFTNFGWIRFNGDGTYQYCQKAWPNLANANLDNNFTTHRDLLKAAYDDCIANQFPIITPVAIPVDGAIFFAKNSNIGVFGTVDRRVTVVAMGGADRTDEGCIHIPKNVEYPGGALSASINFSFAALARNFLFSDNFDGGDDKYQGVTFSMQQGRGGDNHFFRYGGGVFFRFYGTMGAGWHGLGAITPDMHYDAMLNRYPPPGLPERPLLVSWKMK